MPQALSDKDCHRLADTIDDLPMQVVKLGALRTGRCLAWAVGDPSRPEAAVIQAHPMPAEPMGLGSPAGIDLLLSQIDSWNCVSVASDVAGPLAKLISSRYGECRLYRDLCFVSEGAPPTDAVQERNGVHLLGPSDGSLHPSFLTLADEKQSDLCFLMENSVIAAAVVAGEVVAEAHCGFWTQRYGDIAINTRKDHRGRGLATGCAKKVMGWLRARGLTPVWSAGHDNHASLRVAQKLGFSSVGETQYVIRPR